MYIEPMKKFKWESGNTKLPKRVIHTSIPSGWTCVSCAKECLSFADELSGKIKDGTKTKFRCYSATQEARNKHIRQNRWYLL